MSTKVNQWLLVAGLVFGQMLVGAPTVNAQVTSNTRTTSTTSFLDTCTNEVVQLTIETHIVTRLVRTDPDGTRHFRTSVNFQGDGVGISSGTKYRYMGNSQREFSAAAGVCAGSGMVETYTRLISQGSSDNRYVRTSLPLVVTGTFPACSLVAGGPPTFSLTCNG